MLDEQISSATLEAARSGDMAGAVSEYEHDYDPAGDNSPGSYDFDIGMQRKIATLMLRDSTFALRAKDLIKPEYFTETAIGQTIEIVRKHVDTYKASPDMRVMVELLKDEIKSGRLRDDMKDDVKSFIKDAYSDTISNANFALDKVREFAKNKAYERAILASVTALEKGNYAAIEKLFKEASAVGNETASQDYDYFKEIVNRTQRREDLKNGKLVKRGITTGYPDLDRYLYHMGWGRREISVMMGAAKAGKSMSLGDFTKNAALSGFNTFYGSCEVAAWIIAERTDANIAEIAVRDLHVDPAKIEQRIRDAEKRAGSTYRMRDFPSGTLKVSQLYRILEDYKADGVSFDLITVDYADIMAGEYRADNLRDNLREIYIDLRALAHEFDAALLTATQTNRDGAKAATAKATDVGDDWNKIRTADVVIGINATDAEKAAGEARLYWAVSRNTEDGFSIKIQQDRSQMKFIKKVLGKI